MVVKYSEIQVANTIKTNNIVYGINNVGYGPTSSTGFWNGITPSISGYTIYALSNTRPEPSIVCPSNDTDLIFFAKSYSGRNITTVSEALLFLTTGSTNLSVVNFDYPNIVTDGLVMHLDAGFLPSYPRNGNKWIDLVDNNYDGSFISGVTYNSANLGSMTLDGTSYISIDNSANNLNYTTFTYCGWLKFNGVSTNWNRVMSKKLNYMDSNGYEISLDSNYDTTLYIGGSSSSFATFNNISFVGSGWHYLVVEYFGNNVIVYFDNIYKGQGSIAQIVANTNPLLLGKIYNEATTQWNGEMGIISMYNKILTSDEITQNFNSTKSRYGL